MHTAARHLSFQAFDAALAAVHSGLLVNNSLRLEGTKLFVCNACYEFPGRLVVLGIGKAAYEMVRMTWNRLNERISQVIISIPRPNLDELTEDFCLLNDHRVRVFYGPRYNLPDLEVLRGSELVAKTAASLSFEDVLLVLISGGGSAMLTLPRRMPGTEDRLGLDDVLFTIKLVSSAGADICELNSVRSYLDELKAGGLATLAYPAQVISLIVSDVIGDPIRFIASGPTYVDACCSESTQLQLCVSVLRRYQLFDKIPPAIRSFLETGSKSDDFCERKHRTDNWIIGNSMVALRAVIDNIQNVMLSDLALIPLILTDGLNGDASEKAHVLAELLLFTTLHLKWQRDIQTVAESLSSPYGQKLKLLAASLVPNSPVLPSILRACAEAIKCQRDTSTCKSFGLCFVLGGETTVRVKRMEDGSIATKGGRCSHLALQCAIRWYELMRDREDYTGLHCGLLAGASDGLDGPGAYGGGVWVNTSPDATIATEDAYHEAVEFLRTCNSYTFFQVHKPNCIIPARLTNTNVMDILIGTAVINIDQCTIRAPV